MVSVGVRCLGVRRGVSGYCSVQKEREWRGLGGAGPIPRLVCFASCPVLLQLLGATCPTPGGSPPSAAALWSRQLSAAFLSELFAKIWRGGENPCWLRSFGTRLVQGGIAHASIARGAFVARRVSQRTAPLRYGALSNLQRRRVWVKLAGARPPC